MTEITTETCPSCGGTGWFEDPLHAGEPCPFCNGKGVLTVGGDPPAERRATPRADTSGAPDFSDVPPSNPEGT